MLPRNNRIEKTWFSHRWTINLKISITFLFISFQLFLPGPAMSENTIISFFQNHISAIDGNRCQMTPSCSAYASQAIDKHGPIIGWVMACDRLVRCGHDEVNIAPKITINKISYAVDSIESNDTWWFSDKKEQ